MATTLSDSLGDTRIDTAEFYSGDYHETFRRLRSADPVHWQADTEMWIVTRHADLKAIAGDTTTFSNNYGVTVGSHAIARRLWNSAGHSDDQDRRWQLAELRQAIGRRSSAAPDIDNLQSLDPPDHAVLRRVLSRSFTPGVLRTLEDRIRELTRSTLDDVVAGDTGDFMDLLAVPVPIYVIAELLGVAKEDRDDFRRWSNVVVSAVEPKNDAAREQDALQLQEMFTYFRSQIALRRIAPKDDLLTLMIEAEVGGAPLSSALIETLAKLILSAGNETTRSGIAGAALALIEHPTQRAKLVADPSLIGPAVDEFLRWVSPVRAFCRTATADIEVAGRQVRRGDFLALSYVSANRDEAAWPDAMSFDVTRKVAPGHMAFGHGPHICLGQTLARIEMRVVVEELLTRFPDFRLAGEPTVTPSTMVNSISAMPVVFD